MGKRSSGFIRRERDYYPTPIKAVEPLVRHIEHLSTYAEPMAGNGALVQALDQLTDLKCTWMSDIDPKSEDIYEADCFNLTLSDYGIGTDLIITNPMWDRRELHRTIEYLSAIRPTWLLFDADWIHTLQSRPYLKYLQKVQSVGRIKWIEDTTMTGKTDCCWYLFSRKDKPEYDRFKMYGRT